MSGRGCPIALAISVSHNARATLPPLVRARRVKGCIVERLVAKTIDFVKRDKSTPSNTNLLVELERSYNEDGSCQVRLTIKRPRSNRNKGDRRRSHASPKARRRQRLRALKVRRVA